MPASLILMDTNVIVAALVQDHLHHAPSLALFTADVPMTIAVAAHSFAEAFTTLTRRGDHAPFRWPPPEAWAALESVAAVTRLVGLTPAQTFDVVRDFATAGQVGARIYDHLIFRAAQAAGAGMLVTWNIAHFADVGRGMTVRTPVTALE